MTVPKFDPTISITHLIAIAGIMFSGIGMWSSYRIEMRGVITNQETATKRVDTMEARHERLEGRTVEVERKMEGLNEGVIHIKKGIDEIKQDFRDWRNKASAN